MGGGKSGGGGTPAPTAEYSQYMQDWTNQNTYQNPKLGLPDVRGEYSGTPLMTEADYYVAKQNKQQKLLQEGMTLQQQQFAEQITRLQQEQQTLLTNQQAELERKQQEAYRQNQINTRDSLYRDRLEAETAAVDYINTQIAKEKSNASLFGMKYKLSDEDKATRISDYFASIWSADNDTKLSGLFDSVGKPEGYVDFTVKRGDSGNVPTTTQKSSEAVSKIVGTTKGTNYKNRPVTMTSLLTSNDNSGSTLLGG